MYGAMEVVYGVGWGANALRALAGAPLLHLEHCGELSLSLDLRLSCRG